MSIGPSILSRIFSSTDAIPTDSAIRSHVTNATSSVFGPDYTMVYNTDYLTRPYMFRPEYVVQPQAFSFVCPDPNISVFGKVTIFSVVPKLTKAYLAVSEHLLEYTGVDHYDIYHGQTAFMVSCITTTRRIKTLDEISRMVHISLTERDLHDLGVPADIILRLGCNITVSITSIATWSVYNIGPEKILVHKVIDPDLPHNDALYIPGTMLAPEDNNGI